MAQKEKGKGKKEKGKEGFPGFFLSPFPLPPGA
jgi:hypothetical protein